MTHAAPFVMTLASTVPRVAAANERNSGEPLGEAGWGFKVLIGGHALLGRPRAVPTGVPDANDEGGVLATTSLSVQARSHLFLGAAMDIEGSRVTVGAQEFGIATVRAMVTSELFFQPRSSRAGPEVRARAARLNPSAGTGG